ncbi:unnamed protein product, partial [Cuscuta epithymum]
MEFLCPSSNIRVMIKVHGEWDSNLQFHSLCSIPIDIPLSCSFHDFCNILNGSLGLKYMEEHIRISYVFELCPPPVVINDDASLMFYLQMKFIQSDVNKLPLCIEVLQPVQGGIVNEVSNDGTTAVCDDGHLEVINETEPVGGPNETTTFAGDIVVHDSGIECSDLSPLSFGDNVLNDDSPSSFEVPLPSFVSHFDPTRLAVDAIYESKKDFDFNLKMFAITNFFQYRTLSSSPKVLHVICVYPECKWAARAVRVDESGLFQVRRFDNKHTCPIDVRQANSRQASASLIAELIKHEFDDVAKKVYTPHTIMADMQRIHGIVMSYKKAWHAREIAIRLARGSEKDSYKRLPSLCHMLDQANTGSIVTHSSNSNGEFEYFFMSLAPWRAGWEHCIPVIIVDGSFMKSYYKGTLLTACTQDANKQIFPLAFAICSVENTVNWTWFFNMLKKSLTHREDLYVVSDRHEGILNAVHSVFPHAEHGFCVYHILGNIKSKFRGSARLVSWKFLQAARAGSVYECEEYLSMLDYDDPEIRRYLERIGHDKWSRAYASRNRYSVMMSNNAESLNAVVVTAREYPICKLIEFIVGTMQKWFCDRREAAAANESRLSAHFESQLILSQANAAVMQVRPSCNFEFEVFDRKGRIYVVNLRAGTCTCREFQLDGFICVHAVAAIRSRPGLSCYDYIPQYYTNHKWVAAYDGIIHPIGSPDGWVVPRHVSETICNPPSCSKRPPGRPKKRRIPSIGEHVRKQKCTRCLTVGHNKKTCRN